MIESKNSRIIFTQSLNFDKKLAFRESWAAVGFSFAVFFALHASVGSPCMRIAHLSFL
ncbi:hypothetical protein [Helicobacter fennelliae]|uniref:hypothetical protein n=1 Tax=Helicobacter fennelliae TaxID=215 RepID=UPI001C6E09F8|nr:hypothetical protein [Helicobacter fennelliae]